MRRVALFALMCLMPVFAVFSQSDTQEILARCGYDAETLRAAIEQDGWNLDELILVRWLPNCRYLAMRLPSRYGDPGMIIVWDAAANVRLGTLETWQSYYWDPNGNYLTASAENVGTYLWHLPTNHLMLINDSECGLYLPHWDYEHNLVYATSAANSNVNWCSPYVYKGGLSVYDLLTGEEVAWYPIGGYTLDYEFSADGRYLIITGYGYNVPAQIWDLGTGQQVAAVDIDQGGGIVHTRGQIELSPDGRYLAIGMLYLRIWDLTQLPNDLDEQETTYRYEGPAERIREVRFIDAQTIETTTRSGTQHWNFLTGEQLP